MDPQPIAHPAQLNTEEISQQGELHRLERPKRTNSAHKNVLICQYEFHYLDSLHTV